MNGSELFSRTLTTIQEMHLKIGDFTGSVSLYYPCDGNFSTIGREFREASSRFPGIVLEELPGRLRVIVSEEDCRRIAALPVRKTVKDVASLIKTGASAEEFRAFIGKKYPGSKIVRSEWIDFDWILVFPPDLDSDVYCLSEELGRLTYHRFSREEYLALGFGLPSRCPADGGFFRKLIPIKLIGITKYGTADIRSDPAAASSGGRLRFRGSDMQNIYLDNAATSRMRKEVLDAMIPFFTEEYGNPSSIHSMSRTPRAAVKKARKQIADCINADPSEIFFTSGGTESDNWALIAGMEMLEKKGKHIIISSIEHHAVLETSYYLERRGFRVTRVGTDSGGIIKMDELEKAIGPDTVMISVMTANNEIGSIQPVAAIGKLAHERGIVFHTDAVQAFGHIPLDVKSMNIDMLSASGHKFGGPKGVGFLFVRKGIKLPPFMHGGEQEEGRRAGTTNVPGVVGMGLAAELACKDMEAANERLIKLRDHLIDRVLKEIPYSRLNGDRKERLPSNADFSFEFIEGESMLMSLGMKGICVSTGSACASGSLDPSHVLLGIGLPHEIAHGSIRITIPEETTMEQIDYAADCLKQTVETMRSLSPLYDDFLKKQKV